MVSWTRPWHVAGGEIQTPQGCTSAMGWQSYCAFAWLWLPNIKLHFFSRFLSTSITLSVQLRVIGSVERDGGADFFRAGLLVRPAIGIKNSSAMSYRWWLALPWACMCTWSQPGPCFNGFMAIAMVTKHSSSIVLGADLRLPPSLHYGGKETEALIFSCRASWWIQYVMGTLYIYIYNDPIYIYIYIWWWWSSWWIQHMGSSWWSWLSWTSKGPGAKNVHPFRPRQERGWVEVKGKGALRTGPGGRTRAKE